jgi:hypothetical protein
VHILTNPNKDLVDYESSLPTRFNDVPMKQKQKLIEHHGKALKIVQAQ